MLGYCDFKISLIQKIFFKIIYSYKDNLESPNLLNKIIHLNSLTLVECFYSLNKKTKIGKMKIDTALLKKLYISCDIQYLYNGQVIQKTHWTVIYNSSLLRSKIENFIENDIQKQLSLDADLINENIETFLQFSITKNT